MFLQLSLAMSSAFSQSPSTQKLSASGYHGKQYIRKSLQIHLNFPKVIKTSLSASEILMHEHLIQVVIFIIFISRIYQACIQLACKDKV